MTLDDLEESYSLWYANRAVLCLDGKSKSVDDGTIG